MANPSNILMTSWLLHFLLGLSLLFARTGAEVHYHNFVVRTRSVAEHFSFVLINYLRLYFSFSYHYETDRGFGLYRSKKRRWRGCARHTRSSRWTGSSLVRPSRFGRATLSRSTSWIAPDTMSPSTGTLHIYIHCTYVETTVHACMHGFTCNYM